MKTAATGSRKNSKTRVVRRKVDPRLADLVRFLARRAAEQDYANLRRSR